MKAFEAILHRNFREKGWRFFLTFLAFMIGGRWWRAFVALLLFSHLLPKDIETSEEEILLSLPLRRWEIFLYDFIQGSGILLLSATFSSFDFIKSILILPYVYAITVLSSYYKKGNFILPLIVITLDSLFSHTAWGYFSPLAQRSVFGALITIVLFVLAFLVYSTDGKIGEGISW